jgi:hypothetical protein
MYFRTARRMRQAQLAPPVWLLPYLEPREDVPQVWPPTQSSAEVAADLAERAESVGRLARRKRTILLALALNFVAGWAAAGAYLYESKRGGEFRDLPSTSILGSSVDTLSFAGLEGGTPTAETSPPDSVDPAAPPPDTAAVRIRNEQRQAFFRRRDSLALVARADSEARATAEAQRVRDSIATAIRDSIASARVVLTPPPAALPPAPAPPPPLPPPDAAVELERATDVITTAARALVSGMESRQQVAQTVVPAASRAQFSAFVTQNRPSVSLLSVAVPVLGDGVAAAEVVVQFQWRGTFGDTRRRAVRFRAEATRIGSGEWRLAGLTPLDASP